MRECLPGMFKRIKLSETQRSGRRGAARGFNAAEIEILTGPPPAARPRTARHGAAAPPRPTAHTDIGVDPLQRVIAWPGGESGGARHSTEDGGALTKAAVSSLLGDGAV